MYVVSTADSKEATPSTGGLRKMWSVLKAALFRLVDGTKKSAQNKRIGKSIKPLNGPNEQERLTCAVQKAIHCIDTEWEALRCFVVCLCGVVKAVGKGRLPAGGGHLQEEARRTNARQEGCLWAQGERVPSSNISNLTRYPLVSIGNWNSPTLKVWTYVLWKCFSPLSKICVDIGQWHLFF